MGALWFSIFEFMCVPLIIIIGNQRIAPAILTR